MSRVKDLEMPKSRPAPARSATPNLKRCDDSLWSDGQICPDQLTELLRRQPGAFDDAFLGDLLTMSDELLETGTDPSEICECVRRAVCRATESFAKSAKKAAAKRRAVVTNDPPTQRPNVQVVIGKQRTVSSAARSSARTH